MSKNKAPKAAESAPNTEQPAADWKAEHRAAVANSTPLKLPQGGGAFVRTADGEIAPDAASEPQE